MSKWRKKQLQGAFMMLGFIGIIATMGGFERDMFGFAEAIARVAVFGAIMAIGYHTRKGSKRR